MDNSWLMLFFKSSSMSYESRSRNIKISWSNENKENKKSKGCHAILTSKQHLEEKLQSAGGELSVVGNDLFSHWEGGGWVLGWEVGGCTKWLEGGGGGGNWGGGCPGCGFPPTIPMSPQSAWSCWWSVPSLCLACCNGNRKSFPIVSISI